MTDRLADVVAQVKNVRQLEAVVTAMRGLAASRAQKGRAQLPGVEAYSAIVSRAIGQALSLLPDDAVPQAKPARERLGLVVFGAEQGFAGAFSERVLAAVESDLARAHTLVVGTRAAAVAAERGIVPAGTMAMPTQIDAVPAFASRVVDRIYGFLASGTMTRIDIVFARMAGGTVQADRHSLLPVDFSRFAAVPAPIEPLVTLEPRVLIERLAAEYVFAQLCAAAMHALEAENEARMLAMASARTNIATRLEGLRSRESQLRQQEITTEIVELAAGAGALTRR